MDLETFSMEDHLKGISYLVSLSSIVFLSVADLSATDYGIAAECSLSVCLCVCVYGCVNHGKIHSDFF